MTEVIEFSYVFVFTCALIFVAQKVIHRRGGQSDAKSSSKIVLTVALAAIMAVILRTDEMFANFVMSFIGG